MEHVRDVGCRGWHVVAGRGFRACRSPSARKPEVSDRGGYCSFNKPGIVIRVLRESRVSPGAVRGGCGALAKRREVELVVEDVRPLRCGDVLDIDGDFDQLQ